MRRVALLVAALSLAAMAANAAGRKGDCNRDAIMAYQRQMIDHFKRAGERRADITFENYMTRLANQESIASGQRASGEICQPSNSLAVTANSIGTSKDFRAFAATQAAANRASFLACK